MKTSVKMQEIIIQLAEKHGLDLAAPQAYLRLEMEGFMRLVIMKIGKNQVRIGHYFEQQGGLIPDPEIIFFMGYVNWVPIKVTQVIGGTRFYCVPTPDGESIVIADEHRQADLAEFAEMWGRNIEAQGWLEHGKKWNPCDPSNHEQPGLELLMEWGAEGGCEAVDGCWVESDGTCPHGCQSWMLVLGLI